MIFRCWLVFVKLFIACDHLHIVINWQNVRYEYDAGFRLWLRAPSLSLQQWLHAVVQVFSEYCFGIDSWMSLVLKLTGLVVIRIPLLYLSHSFENSNWAFCFYLTAENCCSVQVELVLSSFCLSVYMSPCNLWYDTFSMRAMVSQSLSDSSTMGVLAALTLYLFKQNTNK